MGRTKWVETFEDNQLVTKEYHRATVYKFNMGDVEDPEIYAGAVIYDWQQTPKGKFIMEHGRDHSYDISIDHSTYGYMCVIRCEIESKKLSEYYLKWGKV